MILWTSCGIFLINLDDNDWSMNICFGGRIPIKFAVGNDDWGHKPKIQKLCTLWNALLFSFNPVLKSREVVCACQSNQLAPCNPVCFLCWNIDIFLYLSGRSRHGKGERSFLDRQVEGPCCYIQGLKVLYLYVVADGKMLYFSVVN